MLVHPPSLSCITLQPTCIIHVAGGCCRFHCYSCSLPAGAAAYACTVDGLLFNSIKWPFLHLTEYELCTIHYDNSQLQLVCKKMQT